MLHHHGAAASLTSCRPLRSCTRACSAPTSSSWGCASCVAHSHPVHLQMASSTGAFAPSRTAALSGRFRKGLALCEMLEPFGAYFVQYFGNNVRSHSAACWIRCRLHSISHAHYMVLADCCDVHSWLCPSTFLWGTGVHGVLLHHVHEAAPAYMRHL